MRLVTGFQKGPSSKSARGKRDRRRLEVMALSIPSLMALDLMLDADSQMTGNPELRRRTRDLLISLNPKLTEETV